MMFDLTGPPQRFLIKTDKVIRTLAAYYSVRCEAESLGIDADHPSSKQIKEKILQWHEYRSRVIDIFIKENPRVSRN